MEGELRRNLPQQEVPGANMGRFLNSHFNNSKRRLTRHRHQRPQRPSLKRKPKANKLIWKTSIIKMAIDAFMKRRKLWYTVHHLQTSHPLSSKKLTSLGHRVGGESPCSCESSTTPLDPAKKSSTHYVDDSCHIVRRPHS